MLLLVNEGRSGESKRVVGRDQADYVEQVLRELLYVGGQDRFVILTDWEKEPGNRGFFIQCHFGTPEEDPNDGLVLEYREGSDYKHYRCLNDLSGLFGLELVIKAFVDYLHGKEDWHSSLEWEQATEFIEE